MHKTTLFSFNCWSGGVPSFHSFFHKITKRADYMALQEVHRAKLPGTPRRLMPRDPGTRRHPIRTHLCEEIDKGLGSGWQSIYMPHINGCHDFEPDERLQYGQYTAVRKQSFEILCTARKFIYGRYSQFNTENVGGTPCGKVAIGTLLRRTHTDEYLAVVNVHGFTSIHGKTDSAERFEQNAGINALIERLRDHAPTKQVHVIVLGDLNYTSRMVALYDLVHRPSFGSDGGAILNHEFGIKDTRTHWYQKPIREADFAIVSRSLLPHIHDFRVLLDDVPSDHGLLELTLDL